MTEKDLEIQQLRAELKRYKDAEKDGRLVVLPCKLGDTVYAVMRYGGKPLCVVQDVVQMIGVTSKSVHVKLRSFHEHNKTYIFGKTVFLTRSDAEAALKGGSGRAD